MVSLEKLSAGNIDKFRNLNVENLKMNTYDKNFFEYYDNEKFLLKFLYKKFVKLFLYNREVIGYIWYEIPLERTIHILSIYVKPPFIDIINENTLNNFNNNTLIYESKDTDENNKLLTKLGFKKSQHSTLMSLNLSEYNKSLIISKLQYNLENNIEILYIFKKLYKYKSNKIVISVEEMKINCEEYLRCSIQNEIFYDKNRIPLDIEDIENDINQDYYRNKLSLFIKINGVAIGYGQIIFNNHKYTVVNFGIIKEFRGFGFGKILLNSLITKFFANYSEDLFIRVEDNNLNAIKLYSWIGFKPRFVVSRWERI